MIAGMVLDRCLFLFLRILFFFLRVANLKAQSTAALHIFKAQPENLQVYLKVVVKYYR